MGLINIYTRQHLGRAAVSKPMFAQRVFFLSFFLLMRKEGRENTSGLVFHSFHIRSS